MSAWFNKFDQSIIENSVIFDNVKIGKRVRLNKCIPDKHVVIPDGEIIGDNLQKDQQQFSVTDDDIVIIPQGYILNKQD